MTSVAGIRTLTLPATLFDLAATVHPKRIERAIDTVTSRAPDVLVGLHRLLEEYGARGRNGTALVRALLADRPAGYIPPTRLERRFEQLVAEAGDRPLRRQVNVGGHQFLGRTDYLDDPPNFGVEVNSRTYHSSHMDQRADEERYALMRAAGIEILPIHEDTIWDRPWEVPILVRRGRARAAKMARVAS